MSTHLRYATRDDAAAMYDISCRAHMGAVYQTMIPPEHYARFYDFYTPSVKGRITFIQRVELELADPIWKLWVAEVDDVVVGYTAAKQDGGAWRLKGLFVLPEYQGRGVGRQLFRMSCAASPVGLPTELTVIANNSRAVGMYEAEGFRYTTHASSTFYGAEQIVMHRQTLT